VKKVVFVSDLFVDSYRGGAELTTAAIMLAASSDKFEVSKINSQHVNEEVITRLTDAHWVICNFSALSDKAKVFLCKNVDYSIVEYDYKICHYRSIEKHKAITGTECNCLEDMSGKINQAFYGYAKKIWFMSKAQQDIFLSRLKVLKEERCEVLSSIFSPGDLRFMESLRHNEKDNTYLILGSGSWIKGTQESIEFAKKRNLNFEVIQNLPYHELLIKLSTSKGLIFQPLGGDTCPRIVIEARLLECDLILNDNVQHKDEEWFKTTESSFEYLNSRVDKFWEYYG
jgi:hypothetical protein